MLQQVKSVHALRMMTVSQIVGLTPVSCLLDPHMSEWPGSSVVAGGIGLGFCSLAGLS